MEHKNKFDLISRLSSFNGVAELCILRRANGNCYGTANDSVPYHNGIFAQNSIKLAMRKYEKPSMKSGSDADIDTWANNFTINEKDLISKINLETEETENQVLKKEATENSLRNVASSESTTSQQSEQFVEMENILVRSSQCKDQDEVSTINSSMNGLVLTSYHSDNWLFCDKRQLKQSTHEINNLTYTLNQEEEMIDDDYASCSFTCDKKYSQATISGFSNAKMNEMYFFNFKNEICSSLDNINYTTKKAMANNNLKTENVYISEKSIKLIDANTFNFQPTNSAENFNIKTTELPKMNLTISTSKSYESFELASLTYSSCHSERSVAHLNCLVCQADETLSSSATTHENLKTKTLDTSDPDISEKHYMTYKLAPNYHVHKTESSPPSEESRNKYISTLKIEIKCPVIEYISSPEVKEINNCVKIVQLKREDLEEDCKKSVNNLTLEVDGYDNDESETYTQSMVSIKCGSLKSNSLISNKSEGNETLKRIVNDRVSTNNDYFDDIDISQNRCDEKQIEVTLKVLLDELVEKVEQNLTAGNDDVEELIQKVIDNMLFQIEIRDYYEEATNLESSENKPEIEIVRSEDAEANANNFSIIEFNKYESIDDKKIETENIDVDLNCYGFIPVSTLNDVEFEG